MMTIRVKTAILAFLVLLVSSCKPGSHSKDTLVAVNTDSLKQEKITKNMVFGLPADSFTQLRGKVKPNGFLSSILLEHGVTMQEIDQLTKNSKQVFNVRNIRSGNNYILFCEPDSIGRARYFVYEHDPTTSYIFSFRDSLNITEYKKEITKVIRYSKGTIETSMWDAMMGNGLHPELAAELSNIFAWTVDFFGLQKGDNFRVIYEEKYIDDKPIGIGKVFGAQFTWSGKPILAVPFIQGGKESFYDSDGNSLRKAFLKAPLSFARITSRFSSARLHPILRIVRPHYGIDYAAPIGTPVHAVGDGRIVSATIDAGSGRMVRIVHNSVYSTAYMHLSGFGEGIYTGATVKQGDIIGYVGSSGLSTGPHLDFRFFQNGYPVDPLKVEAPPVEPIADSNRVAFERSKRVIESLLSTI
jgi:murein DD-endopeptidase MepM/ murein hydrolase activator NlpD